MHIKNAIQICRLPPCPVLLNTRPGDIISAYARQREDNLIWNAVPDREATAGLATVQELWFSTCILKFKNYLKLKVFFPDTMAKPQNEFKKVVFKLEETAVFKEWRAGHMSNFLSHIFVMLDEANKDLYQLGYFDPKKIKTTTFIVQIKNGNILNVQLLESSEILKTDGILLKLDLKKIKLGAKEVLDIAVKFKEDNYPLLTVVKSFFVLQNIRPKQVFNFTFLANSFKTLNIKISSDGGSIVRSSLKSLINILK